ncbi:tRNA-specific adenosine-34 deaminase [hydrothermal vent metagenome]|uniref:tRNA-specific adenosine deaminase 2 n=1 Tax=hydrothermal vent metagenome TaxID=652676 RepID=A0A3B1A1E0_9ZZZZ
MSTQKEQDIQWMQHAIKLAKHAESIGEVPVGAVLIKDNQLIAEGWNQPITGNDPTAHAEMMALRTAAQTLNNYRLVDTTLYITLEPCAMCAGALMHARVKRVVFGASDPRTGAAGSVFNILNSTELNHTIDIEYGVLQQECGELLTNFFRNKRK